VSLVAPTWTDISIDLAAAAAANAAFRPAMINQVGFEFRTNSAGDAGAFPNPESVVFHIDSVFAQ
jgi:hypothetical protein